jgi:signal transduction histidine kinase
MGSLDSSAFELALIGFVAAAIAYGGLAVRQVLGGALRAGAGRAASWFLAAVGLSTLWGLAGAAAGLAPDDWPAWMVASADLARYAAWFAFLLVLLRPLPAADEAPGVKPADRSEIGLLPPLAVAIVGFGAVAVAAPLLVDAEGVDRLTLFASMAQPVFGLLLVEQLFRNTARDSRWGAKPLCLALALLFAFDLYIYSQAVLFGAFDADAFSIRAGIHTLAVPLLFVAARRQADWQARLQVSHNAAFYSATLLLAGAYLLFVSGIGYYVRDFGGSWGRALQLAVLFSAIVFLALLVLSGSMRARLRVFVSKNFFAYRYDYREQWLRFTTMLSAPASPQEMGLLVVRGLADMVESPGGSLWTLGGPGDDGDSGFVESGRTLRLARADREPADGPFARFLAAQGWIVDVSEARAHPERYAGLELPGWLARDADGAVGGGGGADGDIGPGEGTAGAHRVWAVVPLIVGEQLTGFVLLARPHAAIALDWEVRDLLKTASRQAAAFLAQLHAAEALLEARKFDAFNRMSAFVVHDLKNIVTQLSLMMKNAKRLHDNPEFRQDMLMTVESSLDKMRQLMLQLREGAKPPGGALGVELLPIVQRIAAVAVQRGRTLELPRIEPVATRGHEERIERVLGHLVANAFDATPAEGRVWLELTRVAGQAQVVVGDTGAGMSREFVETRLFKPFASTKAAGMGIGSYESAQYVRELGGQIRVDSRPGEGTLITVVLPLFESRQDSDLTMASPA